MINKIIRESLLCLLMLAANVGLAQDIEINNIEFLDQKVVISYNLIDTAKGRTYGIKVYCSNDNFINPLQKLTGDIGSEMSPGKNKKIVWDPKSEFGENFKGNVSLELRGKLFVPFVRFSRFEDYKAIKRLKPYQITWTGGSTQNILNFDLYRGDKKVTTFPNIANVGHYKLTLPKDVKPGKNYRFRISDSKNKDDVVYTSKFTVKRKTPLLLKVLPILAVGFAATMIGGGDDPSEIPDPIEPQ